MSWFLEHPPDFSQHNAEVTAVWDSYQKGQPTRIPVSVHGSIRNLIQNPGLNSVKAMTSSTALSHNRLRVSR